MLCLHPVISPFGRTKKVTSVGIDDSEETELTLLSAKFKETAAARRKGLSHGPAVNIGSIQGLEIAFFELLKYSSAHVSN